MVRTQKRGYTKKGDYVEVRVGKAATYKEVAQACHLAIVDADRASSSEDVDDDSDDDAGSLALFRANGTMILDRPIENTSGNVDAWSIGAYMNTFHCYQKTGATIKFGVGYTAKV